METDKNHQDALVEVQRENDRKQKQLERDNKKTLKQFEKIKEQVQDKERTVKADIERVLQEWEDKCADLEDQQSEAKRLQ